MSKPKRIKNQKAAKQTVKEVREDKSEYVFQEGKIDFQLNIKVRHELSDKQQKFLDIMMDKKTNIVFLKGAAGTSKSYLAVLAGLKALNNKTAADLTYIRSPIEVGKSIGYLSGDFLSKISPYLQPLMDKLDELIPKNEVDMLVKAEKVVGTIPNFLRGQSWNAKYVIVDEAQSLEPCAMKAIITRLGRHSKIIFLADESQADIKGRIEFVRYFDMFNNEESKNHGIHCLAFGREDIVRSPILGYILDRIEGTYTSSDSTQVVTEPMFPKS